MLEGKGLSGGPGETWEIRVVLLAPVSPAVLDVTLLQSSCLGISQRCEIVLTRKVWKRCFFQKQADGENVTKQTP